MRSVYVGWNKAEALISTLTIRARIILLVERSLICGARIYHDVPILGG
jgi:hypothetical protein